MPLDLYPKPRSFGRPDRPSASRTNLPAPKGVLRRLPPVVQFVTKNRPDVVSQLRKTAERGFSRGLSLNDIAAELQERCSQLGFNSEIRTAEERFEDLPSYPGQTVLSGMIIMDLQAVAVDDGGERSSA